MRTWWKRVLAALVLGLLPAAAQAAVTWLVVTDGDCTGAYTTGLSTASANCCRGTAASGSNICAQRINAGANFIRNVTFVVGASSVYTAGGDALNTTAIQRIGLTNVVMALCQGSSPGSSGAVGGGEDVNWVQTVGTGGAAYGAKLQLFNAGAGGTTPVTGGGEFAGSIANLSITCMLIGN